MSSIGLTRQEILDCIEAAGAVHKSELCRLVGRGWGTVSHHLRILEREGHVDLQSHGRNTWVFPSDLAHPDRMRRMAVNAPGRRDVLRLLADRDATVSEISDEMAASKKVVRTHLSHLLTAGVVEREPRDPHKYRLRRGRR